MNIVSIRILAMYTVLGPSCFSACSINKLGKRARMPLGGVRLCEQLTAYVCMNVVPTPNLHIHVQNMYMYMYIHVQYVHDIILLLLFTLY